MLLVRQWRILGTLVLLAAGFGDAPGRLGANGGDNRPAVWSAINYAPRGHAHHRMLYDWFDVDSATGRPVKELAAADLRMLGDAGFNAVHLYLWDRPTFEKFLRVGSTRLLESAGFSYPDPRASDRRQWEALEEFVSLAERNRIWVVPHFVHTPFNDGNARTPDFDALSGGEVLARALEIVEWEGVFVDALASRHRNILAWGMLYALEPAPSDDPANPNNYSLLWRKIYTGLERRVRSNAPAGAAAPLITFLFLPSRGEPIVDGKDAPVGPMTGYSLDAAVAKQRYASMKRHLSHEKGKAAEPDLVYTFLFGPDAGALGDSLRALTSGDGAVPADRLFIAEYGISSPFGASSKPMLAFGENGSPTTDEAGQASWLRQCLCELDSAGVRKRAYWTLYDAPDLWSSEIWNLSPDQVALNGHWGLAFDDSARGMKAGWPVLVSANRGETACGSRSVPIVAGTNLPVRWSDRLTAEQPAAASEDRRPADAGLEIRAAVSSASFRVGRWYPGSLMSIFVSGLSDVPDLWQSSSYPLPRSVFGIQVDYLAGTQTWSAPILGVAASGDGHMLNVQVPWEADPRSIRVIQGARSAAYDGQGSYWGDFFADTDGLAVAIHANTRERVTRDNPARASEVVTLYMTNLPRPASVPRTGEPNPATVGDEHRISVSRAKSGYSFGFDGRGEEASQFFVYLGLAPSMVGVCQLTIRVPPVKARQDMSIGYTECQFTHGIFLPCLGAIARRSETKLPVAPAE